MHHDPEGDLVKGGQGRSVRDVKESAIVAAVCISMVAGIAMVSGLCALAWPVLEPYALALLGDDS